jgi:hypothetical protein
MLSILSPAAILAARTKPSRAVANQHHVDIIHEFVDNAYSAPGLCTQSALTELLEWVQQRSDFIGLVVRRHTPCNACY